MVSREWDVVNFTDAEYNRLKRWYERNFMNINNGIIGGAAGGALTFHITPTALGDIIEAECHGKTIIIRDELSGLEDEMMTVIFGCNKPLSGQAFAREVELPTDTSNQQLIKIFEALMETEFDNNTCYIKINGEILLIKKS